jgi:cytochrome c biogenesis protein CcdA
LAALSFGLWSAAYALGSVIPMWGATLGLALVLASVATVSAVTGLRKLRELRLGPERTIETVKENVEWLKRSSK